MYFYLARIDFIQVRHLQERDFEILNSIGIHFSLVHCHAHFNEPILILPNLIKTKNIYFPPE